MMVRKVCLETQGSSKRCENERFGPIIIGTHNIWWQPDKSRLFKPAYNFFLQLKTKQAITETKCRHLQVDEALLKLFLLILLYLPSCRRNQLRWSEQCDPWDKTTNSCLKIKVTTKVSRWRLDTNKQRFHRKVPYDVTSKKTGWWHHKSYLF